MRAPFPVGGHVPLIESFICVPHAYYHPCEPLSGANSATPFLIEDAPGSVLSSLPPRDSWHGLGVRLTGDAAVLVNEIHIDKMKDMGMLAYRMKCDCTINRKVTPDNCELLLLVKMKQSEESTCTFI